MARIRSKVGFYGPLCQTVVMKLILLTLEAESLVFSALWKNSAVSCLRFPQAGANIIKGMCLDSYFLVWEDEFLSFSFF